MVVPARTRRLQRFIKGFLLPIVEIKSP